MELLWVFIAWFNGKWILRWIVSYMIVLVISCDLFNRSLYFLSQIIDHLEVFIWVYGLCVLVGCAGTGHHTHFGWFLGRPVLSSLCQLVRHADLFQYADFASECSPEPNFWYTEPVRYAECVLRCELRALVQSTVWKWSAESAPGCEFKSLVQSTDLDRFAKPNPDSIPWVF